MRRVSFLLLFVMTGCQRIENGLFGNVSLQAQPKIKEVKTEEVKTSSLLETSFGFLIFKLEEKGRNEDFRQALFYALEQSYSRTKQHHYRIVSFGSVTQIDAIKEAMIGVGAPSDRILIQSQDSDQKPAEIYVYER